MIQRRQLLITAPLVAVPAIAQLPELTNFRFGILRTMQDGSLGFDRLTTKIPRRYKDSGFRWGVGFDNLQCLSVEWYEVIHLPADPKQVSGNLQHRRTSILRTKTFRSSEPTRIDDFWFDPGDPLGLHLLEVYVHNLVAFRVEFEVVEA